MNTPRNFAALSLLGLSFFAAGCASETKTDIPPTAMMINDAKGDITASAPDDGMVYVYDKSNDELVYSGQVNKGDSIHLDTDKGDVRLNDHRVSQDALIHDHRHEIYFDKHPRGTVIEHHTTIVEPQRDTTYVSPDGKQTTVVTPSDSEHQTTIIRP